MSEPPQSEIKRGLATSDRLARMTKQINRELDGMPGLSMALLRTRTCLTAYMQIKRELGQAGLMSALEETASMPTHAIEDGPAARTMTFLPLFLAVLYSAVERYERLRLCDADVDALLANTNRVALEQYRHSVFHADGATRMRTAALPWGSPELVEWSVQLLRALDASVTRWASETPEARVERIFAQYSRS